MHLLGIVCIIYSIYMIIKESRLKDNFKEEVENVELWEKDVLSDMTYDELLENRKNGKYKLTKHNN